MFKQNKLSMAIVAVLASVAGANQAFAQDDAPAVEEVIVTGIRASVEAAMDIKRDSAGVVDAINAEDIGKFPDSNLAESLQRISGVSIDRRNGEGYQVTVRGFGPEFNLITLNGRSMPSTQLNITNGGPRSTRTFDMSNIASEGVSGVEVYKTSKANISSGGIGATVNLKTRRPMDSEGLEFSVGAKRVKDTTVRVGDKYTPEYSGFFSWSDDKFGVSVSYSEQDRASANTGVFTNNWADFSGAWTDASFFEGVTEDNLDSITLTGGAGIGGAPIVGQQVNSTPGVRYHHQDFERTRKNSQVTFQFRPIENLTATLDRVEAEQETKINSAELSYWFGGGSFPVTDVKFDGRADVATPVYLWTENATGNVRDLGITQNAGHYQNTLESTGLNVEFLASDTLSITLDAHNTKSESLPGDGSIANYINIAVGAQGNWAQGFDNTGDIPLLVGAFRDVHQDGSGSDGILTDELDIADVGSTVRQIYNDRATSDMKQVKLDFAWEYGDAGKIDFGVERSEMEAVQRRSESQEVLEGNWGVGTPGDVPVLMMEELDFADLLDGYRTELTPEGREFFDDAGIKPLDLAGDVIPRLNEDGTVNPAGVRSGSSGEVLTKGFIAKDVAALGELLSYNAGLPWQANPNDNLNRTIREDTTAVYVQGSYNMDLADMPLSILAGIRHESTDVESIGQVAPSAIDWQGDNDFARITGNAYDAPIVAGEGSYSITLPSIDLSLGITDDVIARLSYGTSIARASYNQLLKGINSVNPPEGGPTILGARAGTARDGNPGLKPLKSNNIDLSFEWYFGDASYASIGYFIKDVPNFVGTATRTETMVDVFDPTAGPRAQAAITQLESLGIDVNQQTLFAMVASMDDGQGGCVNQLNDAERALFEAGTYTGQVCGSAFGDTTDYSVWESDIYLSTTGWEDNVDLRAVDGDPASINRVQYPVDNQSAKLDGFEIAAQHFFGDTGFGVQANYTMVDGDIAFDITADPGADPQFALTGLSDSANLVLMYENYDISARLTYNWRDEFLLNPQASSNEPEHTEAYSQIDFNVGYQFTDEFSVSFEGINITGEDARNFARTSAQLTRLNILGPRYALSARYTF